VAPRGVKAKYDDLLTKMKQSLKTNTFISPEEVQMGIEEAISNAQSTDIEEERKGKALLGKRHRDLSLDDDDKKKKGSKKKKKQWDPPTIENSTKQFS
jgi:hypothetical protein